MDKIILFDGVCNFCSKSVQFIIKRDPHAHFKFVSQQSKIGEKLLKEYHAKTNLDSIVLIDNDKCYYESTAALRICKHLKGLWKLIYILIVIPSPIRDFFYRLIAKSRYKWFGKSDSCLLPSQEEKERFL